MATPTQPAGDAAERLLTPGEVATLFRVDPKTVTRWASAGRIGSIRTPGGHRRFRESEVRSMLASLTSEALPQPSALTATLGPRARRRNGRFGGLHTPPPAPRLTSTAEVVPMLFLIAFVGAAVIALVLWKAMNASRSDSAAPSPAARSRPARAGRG